MKTDDINKILFITLSNIGDVVLTLPVLSALRDNFSTAQIDVLVGPRPKDIFMKDSRINEVFIYDKYARFREKMAFIRELGTKKYDLAVDMRGSLIPFLIGVKRFTPIPIFFPLARGKHIHKKSVHLNKLKSIGIDYRKQKNIYVDEGDRRKIEVILRNNGIEKGDTFIGVSPSCRGLLKEWRREGFIEVIDTLLKRGDYKIALIGDETQMGVSKTIKDAVGTKSLIDLTGRINLNELFALIERMEMLLSCDSACMHIACELGVPVVAIFGPTDAEVYGPTGRYDVVIRKDLKCAPCRKAVCKFHHECMEEISVNDVLEGIRKIL